MRLADVTMTLFMVCNSVRVLAYIPQIHLAATDKNGASAISTSTWSLFLVAHLATVAYAIVNQGDYWLAACFAVNALCCVAVLVTAALNARRHARRQAPATTPSPKHRVRTSGAAAVGAAVVMGLTVCAWDAQKPLSARELRAVACPDTPMVVHGADEPDVATICAGGRFARDELAQCGFTARRAIEIEIVEEILDVTGRRQLGDYLPFTQRVRLLSRSAFGKLEQPDYVGVVIPTEDHYRSVAAHETVHAILHPFAAARDLPVTAHEYAAYAIQIAALPATTRAQLLATGPTVDVDNLFHFSHFLLFADPQRFAVQAYRHRSAQASPCAFLQAVMKGKIHFPPGIGD